MNWKDLHIDKSWTLFLDRDGVLNKKIDDDYVRSIDQFEWLPGVPQAIKKLSGLFGRIIIITNQQGVGKGLMMKEDVESIHTNIIESVKITGGRIDAVYYAPQLKSENSEYRKPNIGMALQAKKDFPEIDFSKSIMVGDSMSDIEFGKKAGMKTVFILNDKKHAPELSMIDGICKDLKFFSEQIVTQ
ncbi:MAG: HAD family hydrolase [Chitinophagaceae bacterium]|nr:HAD family hydrolase [Chitinophagaceae bacterium]